MKLTLFACFNYKKLTKIYKKKIKMGYTELLPEEIAEIKRLSEQAYAFIKDTMSLKMQFEAAVKIVQSLPKEGPYQPSINTKLMFYSLYKQASIGPCKVSRPPFYQVEEVMKWRAWKQLKNMTTEEAMQTYCKEMKKIFDTLPFTKESEDFFFQSGLFLEYEKMPNATISEQYREKYDKRSAEYRGKVKSMLEDITDNVDYKQQSAMANSSGEESSGDSFVVYDKNDDNLEGQLTEGKTKENVNETDSEEEYSDPSETLDLEPPVIDEPSLEARSNSPTSSAFYSVGDAQELQLLGKEYTSRKSERLSLKQDGKLQEVDKIQRSRNRGLSADAASQLLIVLQKIHVDLKEMIVKMDSLEDKSVLRHHSRCCCQREQSRSSSSDIVEKKWWPFPELSPRTTFLLLIWPLILHGGIRFLLFLRFALSECL